MCIRDRLEVGQVVGGEDGRGADRLVDGRAESAAPREVQHVVRAEGLGEQLGGFVGAAGVGADGVLHGPFLAEETAQGLGQPSVAVVGDEHGGDDVPGELGGGGRVLGRRVTMHGHRGTGPPAGVPGASPGRLRAWTAVDARAPWGRWCVTDGTPH